MIRKCRGYIDNSDVDVTASRLLLRTSVINFCENLNSKVSTKFKINRYFHSIIKKNLNF